MSEELEAGQVWEWMIDGAPYNIHEVYLLLRRPTEGLGLVLHESTDYLWEVLNLMTGAVELVTPLLTAGWWDRIG